MDHIKNEFFLPLLNIFLRCVSDLLQRLFFPLMTPIQIKGYKKDATGRDNNKG
jgi:hypothetical protein